jgi:hypothetical protein
MAMKYTGEVSFLVNLKNIFSPPPLKGAEVGIGLHFFLWIYALIYVNV